MTSIFDKEPVIFGTEEKFPIFKRLSLETTSNCNRKCGFCPVATGRRDFVQSMNNNLFLKIIRELYDIKWKGFLQLFLLNEPLLDKEILVRLAFIRKALPNVTIYISTNGDPIDFRGSKTVDFSIRKLEALYTAGANSINLNIYDNGEEQASRYQEIYNEIVRRGIAIENHHKYNKISGNPNAITLTDMRTDRSAFKLTDLFYVKTHENVQEVKAPNWHCARPQRHLVIEWNGRVPLCCATDVTTPEVPVMGDTNTQSLVDIWNNEMFFKYRYFTQNAQRVLPGCNTCTHRMQMAHFVRLVSASDTKRNEWISEAFIK